MALLRRDNVLYVFFTGIGDAPEHVSVSTIDLTGDWQSAHLIAQKYEDDDVASWIHAVVHRMEGDLANAGYWYRRVRRPLREDVSTADELREIEALLAGR